MVDGNVITFPYAPRRLQTWLHQSFKRFNCLVAHRRFGKTYAVLNEIIMKALVEEQRNPHYAYIAPTYKQAKIIAWEYIKDFTKNIPGVKAYEQDLRLEIRRPDRGDKISIFLLGSETPDSIRGVYLDGCVLDEYGTCTPDIYSKVVRPALSDRLGWIIFIGTPNGKNHFYDIYRRFYDTQNSRPDQYFTAILKASVTKVVPESELELAKLEMSEDEYNQEYECDFFAAIQGAYYSKELNDARADKRITKVVHDPAALVDTFWDLGMDDKTTIWFRQKVGNEWHYIDYYENSGEGLDHYVKVIQDKRGYIYGKHVLPHDAAARELGTGVTREETLRNLGLRNTRIQKRQSVLDGIDASRVRLRTSWLDAEKCALGIEALASYTKKWDPKKQVFSKTPTHDWASHAADSFRISALDARPGDDINRIRTLPRMAEGDYNEFGGR